MQLIMFLIYIATISIFIEYPYKNAWNWISFHPTISISLTIKSVGPLINAHNLGLWKT